MPSSSLTFQAIRRRSILTCFVPILMLSFVTFVVAQSNEGAARSTTSSSTSLLESCRSDGFDPWQLSCDTCQLLPSKHQPRCLECCQSYKTTEALTKPYESAVLVYRQGLPEESELQQFLQEHWQETVAAKGSQRLTKRQQSDEMSSARFLFMRPPSQMVLLFDKIVANPSSLSIETLKQQAKEIITLDGYRKDDVRDMLSALLPGR